MSIHPHPPSKEIHIKRTPSSLKAQIPHYMPRCNRTRTSRAARLKRAHFPYLAYLPQPGYTAGITAQACQDRKLRVFYIFRGKYFSFCFLKPRVLQHSVQTLSILPRHLVCTRRSNKKAGFPLNCMKVTLPAATALLLGLPPHPRHPRNSSSYRHLSERDGNFQSFTSAQLLLLKGLLRATLVPLFWGVNFIRTTP